MCAPESVAQKRNNRGNFFFREVRHIKRDMGYMVSMVKKKRPATFLKQMTHANGLFGNCCFRQYGDITSLGFRLHVVSG